VVLSATSIGRNFPAMTALQISGLIEDRAKVEIQGVCGAAGLNRLGHEGRLKKLT